MTQSVAVAVVSWNTRELLRACLASIEQDVSTGIAETWVVDNGSTDGSVEMVQEDFPWVELIEAGRNLGFGQAVNLVAARTSASWIAPANADIELEPSALGELLAAAARDPEAGVLAPRLVTPAGTTQHSVHRFPGAWLAIANGTGARRLRVLGDRLLIEGSWNAEVERRVDWAHGAFLLVRAADFAAVGGFAEDQWMYAEDLDLCWRLRQAGRATRYVPGARVLHHGSAATRIAFGSDRDRRHTAAAYHWMSTRLGPGRARRHALTASAFPALRAAALAVPGRVLGGRWAYRYVTARRQAALHLAGLRAGSVPVAGEDAGEGPEDDLHVSPD